MIYYFQKEFRNWSHPDESVIQKMQNLRSGKELFFSYIVGRVIFKNLADLETCYETWFSLVPYIINLFLEVEWSTWNQEIGRKIDL